MSRKRFTVELEDFADAALMEPARMWFFPRSRRARAENLGQVGAEDDGSSDTDDAASSCSSCSDSEASSAGSTMAGEAHLTFYRFFI